MLTIRFVLDNFVFIIFQISDINHAMLAPPRTFAPNHTLAERAIEIYLKILHTKFIFVVLVNFMFI